MLSPITTFAIFGFATLVQSHMKMDRPIPFGHLDPNFNNSPLDKSGSDFPCKQRPGVYTIDGPINIMPLGSTQLLNFTGSAVHGGGSCQISITYDQAPTPNSVWKVIHSIQGGCPSRNATGNLNGDANFLDPDQYNFPIPNNLPTGTAVLAWTWFNFLGNREMYMNCAPISLTAGTAKRSVEDEELMRRNYTQFVERDIAAYNALPDMFVANIPKEKCATLETFNLAFPNPGDSVENLGTGSLSPPNGTACQVAAVGATGHASLGSGSGATAVTSVSSKATSAAASKATSAGQGGVFVTVATSASAPIASSAAPAASSVVKSSAVASKATPIASSAAPASTGTGSAIAAGTACTTEGMFNCISGTSFQQCASGTWSVVQPVAAGTTCTGGQSMAMGISAVATKPKRHVRFSSPHVRRHLQFSF